MELLFVLAMLGIAYCVYSETPGVAKLLEIVAVVATLGLVAYAQSIEQSLAISLPLSVALATPIWLVCLKMRSALLARRQTVSVSTAELWNKWETQNNGRRTPIISASESLAQRLEEGSNQTAQGESTPTAEPTSSMMVETTLHSLPSAKLGRVTGTLPKVANPAKFGSDSSQVAARRPEELANLELAPMERCRYKRRL